MDKKYIGSVLLYLGMGVVAIFLIVFVLYHLLGLGNVSYSTRPASRITAEETAETEAYLFRSEQVIYGAADKMAYSELKDGENVRENDRVAMLCSCTEEELRTLNSYDELIALLKEASGKGDLSVIDGKLRALSASLRASAQSGSLSSVDGELLRLQTELDRRKKVIGAVSDFNNEIARLTTLRNTLLSSFGTTEKLRAPAAGNFYLGCDGYENLFDEAKLSTITPQDFDVLTSGAPEEPPENKKAVGKIVTDPRWRIAMTVSSSFNVELKQGRTYTLIFSSSGERASAKLERLSADTGGGKTLLVFMLTELPERVPKRCETVKLVVSSQTGLMVPAAAMRCVKDKNGEEAVGVYVKDGNRFRFKKVEVLSKHDGYYLAKEMTPDLEGYKEYLALNDIIVTAGKNLREGYHE